MSLGSVVRIILSSTDPLAARRAGYGRAVIGLGATAVTGPPARPDGRLREPRGIVARHAVEGAPRVGWDRFRSRRPRRAGRGAATRARRTGSRSASATAGTPTSAGVPRSLTRRDAGHCDKILRGEGNATISAWGTTHRVT